MARWHGVPSRLGTQRYRLGVTVDGLSRMWWFPPSAALPRANPGLVTYCPYELDRQPPLRQVDPTLRWLASQPSAPEWSLDNTDATPQRRLARTELEAVLDGVRPPTALAALAAAPALQGKLRSRTGCYLDLGDRVVPTNRGGVLLHFLSDQQWVRHWLVLLGAGQHEPVLSTTRPIGFDLPDDWGEGPDEDQVPAVVPLDGSLDLTVSADSVEEFLYRFWIENEITYRADDDGALPEPFLSYAAQVGGN